MNVVVYDIVVFSPLIFDDQLIQINIDMDRSNHGTLVILLGYIDIARKPE